MKLYHYKTAMALIVRNLYYDSLGVMAKISPRTKLQKGGYTFSYRANDEVLRRFAVEDVFEREVAAYLDATLARGDIVVDVGANVGIHTVRMARRVGPKGCVYAFEPIEHIAEALRHNIRLNNLSCVKVIQQALGGANVRGEMWFPGSGQESRAELRYDKNGSVEVAVFDEFWNKIGRPKVKLMKVDVEGAEEQVLSGACCAFQNGAIEHMVIEVNELGGGRAFQLLKRLESFGYLLQQLDSNNWAGRRIS